LISGGTTALEPRPDVFSTLTPPNK
jgi:hypothetical protein